MYYKPVKNYSYRYFARYRRFEDSKSELGVQVIDVEAHAAMEEASMDAADGSAAGAALIDSLATMRSQLETVQASAEAMVTEEANNSNKRQRVEEGFVQSAPYSAPSATPQAMQPFAPRETTENQSPPFPSPDKKWLKCTLVQGIQAFWTGLTVHVKNRGSQLDGLQLNRHMN